MSVQRRHGQDNVAAIAECGMRMDASSLHFSVLNIEFALCIQEGTTSPTDGRGVSPIRAVDGMRGCRQLLPI